MSLRHHEIAESRHRILNPITEEKLMLLGEICRLQPGRRQLDLACGKGEMLTRWAERHGIGGVGVDLSEVFLTAARERAAELGVSERVSFERGDAGKYQAEAADFDVVSCIGATWIGGGLAGTIELLRPALRPGGLMLIGEPYWTEPAPEAALEAIGAEADDFTSLVGTLDRFEAAGMDLLEMVLADGDSWDRYAAEQWFAIADWLRDTPADHPDAADMRDFLDHGRRTHLEWNRRYLGWGVFVLRAAG
ncbi:class I SAM-dependent methyltransferase [Streptomyces cocklensis]|uniref:Methyltransferase domain-containing protein n=1 Tax=Actinacidiphila cocklensis TaxID=887465 RepID=A0A9W4DS22_9ACTN|nr:methyltransferase domain-containing protein [Actinacidiphila cocklensis]MDD1060706.1 class I SAM-dependent methyltransferase [Actinacidiphila cocklensis]CAG6394567.1 Methyltransferase domain-containing protein [Actinacidiphila cocklensis]